MTFPFYYKSKYTTWRAANAEHNDNKEHDNGTIAVDPYSNFIGPIAIERINWAMKTELPIMDMSVPNPRTCFDCTNSPFFVSSNCKW